jgi:hypothetical protein
MLLAGRERLSGIVPGGPPSVKGYSLSEQSPAAIGVWDPL